MTRVGVLIRTVAVFASLALLAMLVVGFYVSTNGSTDARNLVDAAMPWATALRWALWGLAYWRWSDVCQWLARHQGLDEDQLSRAIGLRRRMIFWVVALEVALLLSAWGRLA